MSLVKILDIDVHFLKAAAGDEFMNEVSRSIETTLDRCEESSDHDYAMQDLANLIRSIETAKYRFLLQQITAKQLYREVVETLDRFKSQHPGFDYLRDPVLNAYY